MPKSVRPPDRPSASTDAALTSGGAGVTISIADAVNVTARTKPKAW